MFCNHCGNQLPDGSSFCDRCGQPVGKAAAPAPAPQAPKKSKAVLVWVIIACVLLSLLIVLAACFLLPKVLPKLFAWGNNTPEPVLPVTDPATDPTDPPIVLPLEGNPYQEYYITYEDYIFSDSDTVYKCFEDIFMHSDEALFIAQQEILARHGATFQDRDVQEYFDQRDWYVPSQAEPQLNAYEQANLTLLQVQLAWRSGQLDTVANPYFLEEADFILPESNTRELMEYELLDLTGPQLTLARNEILARNGYIFSSENLRNYFYSKHWYRPSIQGDDFDFGSMNTSEVRNVSLIKKYENISHETGISIPKGYVYDQYDYSDGYDCFHIPAIDLKAAESINKKIYDKYYKMMQEDYFVDTSPFLAGIAYAVGYKDHIISIVVEEECVWDDINYCVYNISAVTGKTLSDAELYAAFGLTEETARKLLSDSLTKYWRNQFDKHPEVFDNSFGRELRSKTLSERNLSKAKPYIDASGNLFFVVDIYAIAGSETNLHLINQSGSTRSISCKIHN